MNLFYEIVIQENLAQRRFRHFEDLTVTYSPSGETVLTCPIPDPSALLGLLNWLHDLGVVLISIRRLEKTDDGGFDG
ncbi:MAG: hypothetical protein JXA33_10270 [Anaerolineae bacterium]|nr:hypothetical protein [Anaerolineae bacterium]